MSVAGQEASLKRPRDERLTVNETSPGVVATSGGYQRNDRQESDESHFHFLCSFVGVASPIAAGLGRSYGAVAKLDEKHGPNHPTPEPRPRIDDTLIGR